MATQPSGAGRAAPGLPLPALASGLTEAGLHKVMVNLVRVSSCRVAEVMLCRKVVINDWVSPHLN